MFDGRPYLKRSEIGESTLRRVEGETDDGEDCYNETQAEDSD